MLTPEQEAWIVRLAQEGRSQRSISAVTGISRESVRAVVKQHRKAIFPDEGLYDVERPVFTRPPRRCPSCGHVCYMPCLACQMRKRLNVPLQ